ncbi:glucose-1-phosphate cytidylyltransferase [Terasakiella pusilla]|uniref:glucose-1-phosphate cytidylyltransferase n=2 Tax=Terasakiella pusilla TaxID=64973 RepID=UPI003AA876F6
MLALLEKNSELTKVLQAYIKGELSMKVVILAGGFGTRLAEETSVIPKPMVQVGDRPILWHIMKIYEAHGFDEFVLALGYKSEVIKRYFLDYRLMTESLEVSLSTGKTLTQSENTEDWNIKMIETGQNSLTGGRLLRLKPYLENETFMLTYGDGVADVDVKALVEFHKSHGKIATVSAVRPPARFGGLHFDDNGQIIEFIEKPQIGEGWINGGFMVFEPEIFKYLEPTGDLGSLEVDAFEGLAKDGELMAFQSPDFWQCMDTIRDKQFLNDLWQKDKAPWKKW